MTASAGSVSPPEMPRLYQEADLFLNASVVDNQPMSILDLSIAGAQIETRVPLLHDSIHDFRLTLEDGSVIVKGRIAYCQVGELRQGVVMYRCGVEFVEPSSAVLVDLHRFVSAFSAAST